MRRSSTTAGTSWADPPLHGALIHCAYDRRFARALRLRRGGSAVLGPARRGFRFAVRRGVGNADAGADGRAHAHAARDTGADGRADALPEPVPDSPLPSWEELQRTLYETNAYCAALYLGRSSAASLSDALPELLAQKGLDGISYLADIAASACVEQPGDEVFILIPAATRSCRFITTFSKRKTIMTPYPGALLYSSAERCAVAVRCNESDVRPNVLAVFSGLDGEQSFSPRITLENETLLSAPGVYTLIPR